MSQQRLKLQQLLQRSHRQQQLRQWKSQQRLKQHPQQRNELLGQQLHQKLQQQLTQLRLKQHPQRQQLERQGQQISLTVRTEKMRVTFGSPSIFFSTFAEIFILP